MSQKKGGWVQELFPTHPTYQNPINMNPRPLLCKVSWFFGFWLFVARWHRLNVQNPIIVCDTNYFQAGIILSAIPFVRKWHTSLDFQRTSHTKALVLGRGAAHLYRFSTPFFRPEPKCTHVLKIQALWHLFTWGSPFSVRVGTFFLNRFWHPVYGDAALYLPQCPRPWLYRDYYFFGSV